MGAFTDLGVGSNETNPTRAPPAVFAEVERIFRDMEEFARLIKIARAIVKKSGALKRRNVDSASDTPLYNAELLDDLVMEAVARTLAGTRKWDMARVPDPFVYFGGVIGSLWADFCAAEKARRKHEQAPLDEQPFDWRTRRPLTPLQLLIAKEEEKEFQQLWQDFEAELGTDTREDRLARRFLALTQSDIYNPAEQARLLGVTIDEMYRLRERVKRTALRFLARRKR